MSEAIFLRFSTFQSTLPRGSDKKCLFASNGAPPFQSTLPRGSDVVMVSFRLGKGTFQSTLPRGSDDVMMTKLRSLVISIHAPSRERLYII